ncbi:spore cortex biosynthesis protein YabQ [Calidifontibacillus oryziterrae]|uniref:spore cortex biosynthesis protein YabQ n=1 Tax=Calidifontibacillus oryziterrae TaxID=1191699 RepID=UPI0002F33DA5|nr:spore cortex biosynthesis protein YabQ [Calidifontibacillus oryziterrae]
MSLTVQFNTMIAMVVMGGWLGVALDTYGRFLKRPERTSFILFVNDILFWLVQALLFFYILFLVNEGELRFYIILAILCGYAAYQSLFKGIYLKLLEFFIQTSIRIYQLVYRLIVLLFVRPVKIILQYSFVALLFIANVILRILKFLLKIIAAPIKWFFLLLWRRILPQNLKIFLINKAGFFITKKNTIVRWLRSIRK